MSLLSQDRFVLGETVNWRGAVATIMALRTDQVWIRETDGTDRVVHRYDLDLQQAVQPPCDVS